MGLFDFLFGPKRARRIPDRVWLSKEAKLAGILREIEKEIESGSAGVVVVAQFSDVYDQLLILQDEASVAFEVCLATELTTVNAGFGSFGDLDTVSIIVAERHPFRANDEAVFEFGESLSSLCRTIFHLTLDDGVWRDMFPDWIKDMLAKLGMNADECIESRIVHRQLKRAQERNAAKSPGDSPANSSAEWMEINMPKSQ
jgi:hypothetical protein